MSHAFLLLFSLLAAPSPAPPAERASPRAEIEALRDAVERTVRLVQRPAGGHHGNRGQAYHLEGYGVVVVLPPRVLPRPRASAGDVASRRAFADAIRSLEQSLASVTDPDLRQRIQGTLTALRATGQARVAPRRRARTEWSFITPEAPGAPRPPALVIDVERAEAFRREAERAVSRAQRDVRVRLRVPANDLPVPPEPPPAPPRGAAPAPPDPPDPPDPPMILVPPSPPWQMWLETEEPDHRPAGTVVSEVRTAVLRALAGYRGPLGILADSDAVVVAVDFVPAGGARGGQRTLIARARISDLRAHGRGRLVQGELMRRIRVDEY